MKQDKISGVVLAGGLGRRMGGVDKGLQIFNGKPLAHWVIERLAPQVDELLINANQNADDYATLGYPVIADRFPGFAGPLAGLHAALTAARHPLVVTAPCDSPFLPKDLVARLHAALVQDDADLAVARSAARAHPVFCLCSVKLLPQLSDFLAAGGRRVGLWHDALRTVDVLFDDESAFANINTREELTHLVPLRSPPVHRA